MLSSLLLALAPCQDVGTDAAAPTWGAAGPLAFGPEGVLFVGDPKGAQIFALDVQDRGTRSTEAFEVAELDRKAAEMLGTTADEILIHDLAIHPGSGNAYLSVSRGRGPDAAPVLLLVKADGSMEDLHLEDFEHQVAALPNPPPDAAVGEGRRRRNNRTESITDLVYLDGRLYVAGLSNEEFASKLRSIPWPFDSVDGGTSVEVYHGAHGALETRSPVRTFAALQIAAEPHLLAAYTCTPLVKFPVARLQPGDKVRGTTIAELGNRNRPLDMIVYEKDGDDYVLLSNSSRGMMKIPMAEAASVEPITERVGGGGTAGLDYQTLEDLAGVVQMDRLDASRAVILFAASEGGPLTLKTIPLP